MSRMQSVAVAPTASPAKALFFSAREAHSPSAVDGNFATSSDGQLSQLFELSPDLVALAAFEPLRWVRVNPAFKALLGWSEHELIGRPLLEIVHIADHGRLRTANPSGERRCASELQLRLLCKEGGHRWVALHMKPDPTSDSLLLVGHDVTQNKRTLKHLRSASVRIRRENENLEQFVRTAGHDLQEPLRTLSMYSDLLMRTYGSQMPGKSIELLLQIFESAKRMHALVDDLLVYAHASQQTVESLMNFGEVSMEQVLDKVLENLRSSIDECSAVITHDPLPTIFGEEIQLTQLLQNLISNSLKYRCPDGPVKVHVSAEQKAEEWEFSITDNGNGFEPQHAESIFQEFKRLHGREIPGTGLGLPICSRIVSRHGGRIWAEGRPGAGATFWFTLPIHKPAE